MEKNRIKSLEREKSEFFVQRGIYPLSLSSVVLVEGDKEVRKIWSFCFRDSSFPFLVFETPESFLKELPTFSKNRKLNYQFYLDQDFGTERGVGVALSKEIRKTLPDAWIFLVTAYPSCFFEYELNTLLLNGVLPKFPRHLLGTLLDVTSFPNPEFNPFLK